MARQTVFSVALLLGSAVANMDVRQACKQILLGVAGSGSTDAEIAAACRATYPPEMCRDMRRSLGDLPWSAGHIDGACKDWQSRAQATNRNMMEWQELQDTLNDCANKKKEFGYNVPRKSNGRMDLEKTAAMKWEQTQKMQEAYNNYMYPDKGSRLFEERHVAEGLGWHHVAAGMGILLSAALVVGGVAMMAQRASRRREALLSKPAPVAAVETDE